MLKSCKLFWWGKRLEQFVSNFFVSCILGCNICDTRLWTQNTSSLHRSTSNTLVQIKEFFRKSLLYVYLHQHHFRWFIFGLRFLSCEIDHKSDNLQYNSLGRWDEQLIDQASDVPSIIFFRISCKNLCKNHFNLFSYFFITLQKIKIKSFECPKSIRNYEKNNAWNIRRLVYESFVPSTREPAYYIEDCQIFSVIEMFLHCTHCKA